MSAYAQLSGVAVIEARASFPRVGAWTADLRVDAGTDFGGLQLLQLGASSFLGSVVFSAVHRGVAHVRLVGGAGGLAKVLPGQGYLNAPLRVPLEDLVAAAGEGLSDLADSAVLAFQLRHWARARSAAGRALWALLGRVDGAVWRFLPDGKLWVGLETWPTVAPSIELTGYDPFSDRVSLFAEEPGIQPGVTVLERRVDHVEHLVREDRIRTDLWLQEAA